MTIGLAPPVPLFMLGSMKRTVVAQTEMLDALRSFIIETGSPQAGADEPHWESWVTPLGLSSEAPPASHWANYRRSNHKSFSN
jgi:hypothetical protein